MIYDLRRGSKTADGDGACFSGFVPRMPRRLTKTGEAWRKTLGKSTNTIARKGLELAPCILILCVADALFLKRPNTGGYRIKPRSRDATCLQKMIESPVIGSVPFKICERSFAWGLLGMTRL